MARPLRRRGPGPVQYGRQRPRAQQLLQRGAQAPPSALRRPRDAEGGPGARRPRRGGQQPVSLPPRAPTKCEGHRLPR